MLKFDVFKAVFKQLKGVKILAVDKNLFLYDLAVVATLYNEGHYVKEWLDYNLAAGVDHFYLYDHESTDNFKEVLQSYIDAGIVTYTFFPGKAAMFPIYTDALEKYKFFCRYISFIDADEFIFPQNNKSIVEVTDEILPDKPYAGGLAINWNCFGSNHLEKADYSKGVLERFTRRAANDFETNNTVKDIVNPRRISYFDCPHKMNYFEKFFSVNEDGGLVFTLHNAPVTDKKIVINHYYVKSFEEYILRSNGGDGIYDKNSRSEEKFHEADRNEIFDDSILTYYEIQLKQGGRKAA